MDPQRHLNLFNPQFIQLLDKSLEADESQTEAADDYLIKQILPFFTSPNQFLLYWGLELVVFGTDCHSLPNVDLHV